MSRTWHTVQFRRLGVTGPASGQQVGHPLDRQRLDLAGFLAGIRRYMLVMILTKADTDNPATIRLVTIRIVIVRRRSIARPLVINYRSLPLE
jgi:hypothetical protein